MNRNDLLQLLKFAEFTNLFASVLRKTIINKDGTAESNSQHSFQMALISWYINDVQKLKLNVTKLIQYALVHDLIETYSGTYPAYKRDTNTQKAKDEAEKYALNKIRTEFNEFDELIKSLNEYNKKVDKESKFIYALDKLIPIINIELNNHDFYRESQTTYEDMLKVKEDKVAVDPIIYGYFSLLKEYLTKEVKFFWPDNKDRDYSGKVYTFK